MFRACGLQASSAVTPVGSVHKSRGDKVAVIQESKLSSNSKTPSIQNFTTLRKDRRQGQGGGLLTLIHKLTNISQKTESPETLVEPHLEELILRTIILNAVSQHIPSGRHRINTEPVPVGESLIFPLVVCNQLLCPSGSYAPIQFIF